MVDIDGRVLAFAGVDTLMGKLRVSGENVTEAMVDIIWDVLTDVYQESQVQVPVDTGALKNSGSYGVNRQGRDVIGTVSYSTPYAFHVHEDLAMTHPRGGKAKFVEDPMNKALGDLTNKARGKIEAAWLGQGLGSGSRDHAKESAATSRHSNSRSLSQRHGTRDVEQAMEMLRRASSFNDVAPHLRATVVPGRGSTLAGKTKLKFTNGGAVGSYHYDPTAREVGGRIPRGNETSWLYPNGSPSSNRNTFRIIKNRRYRR